MKQCRDVDKSGGSSEAFRPIPVAPIAGHRWRFKLRCLVDLQLKTIAEHLYPLLSQVNGKLLDVGAGESPWRAWLSENVTYCGLDIDHADQFGMQRRPEITYYDGFIMPFPDSHFDGVLCIEVLEHSRDPDLLVSEMSRVLREGGLLLLSVPWSARQHYLPDDYHRFTSEQLGLMLAQHGFHEIQIKARGSDIGAIANKLVILSFRLIFPRPRWQLIWTAPLAILSALLAACFLIAAHCSDGLGMGSKDDPLGYFVSAVRITKPKNDMTS